MKSKENAQKKYNILDTRHGKKRLLSLGNWDRRVDENVKLTRLDPIRGLVSSFENLATTRHSSISGHHPTALGYRPPLKQNQVPSRLAPTRRFSISGDNQPPGLKYMPSFNQNRVGLEEHRDRFIPNRTSTNFELGHHRLFTEEGQKGDPFDCPKVKKYKETIAGTLMGVAAKQRILGFKQKSDATMLNTEFERMVTSVVRTRHISPTSLIVLDAPGIVDDFDFHPIDWSAKNIVAICLGCSVYMWDATSQNITTETHLDSQLDKTTAVSWEVSGNLLAIGTSYYHTVQLYDSEACKIVRTLATNNAVVGSLTWNEHILTSGSHSGEIQHHDVRAKKHLVGRFHGHSRGVCGLKWSPDGRYLASGGSNNVLSVYPDHRGLHYTRRTPLYEFTDHKSSVKALAWCPWQPYLLASGGGQDDKQIAFWDCNIGKQTSKVKTNSQVTGLLWSNKYHELASSHSHPRFQVALWKYPSMNQVAELTGHTERIIDMALSPNGQMVMSASSDETLRLWNCFAEDSVVKKKIYSRKSILDFNIIR